VDPVPDPLLLRKTTRPQRRSPEYRTTATNTSASLVFERNVYSIILRYLDIILDATVSNLLSLHEPLKMILYY
jgi:hypothetical protein